MVRHAVLTLSGAAQQLSSMLIPDLPAKALGQPGLVQLWLQPDGANANPVYIGGDDTVSASNYGIRLEAGATGVPPAPISLTTPQGHPKYLTLADIWVFGTNTQKLTVLWIPYI